MATTGADRLALRVTDIQAEARDVILVELRAANAQPLPAFEPGAHLEVDVPNGLIRHYSLTNDSRERDRYVIGVGRAFNGRGGSEFLHRSLRCDAQIRTSTPRNNFALDAAAASYLFIAGGIGITPIIAMIRWCIAHERPWRLLYAVRSCQRAAFYETLRPFGSRVRFHFDDQADGVFDPGPWLRERRDGEHVYCCGPQALMDGVKACPSGHSETTLHFEYFTPPVTARPTEAPADREFCVELRRSGKTIAVPADRSILEALEASGVSVPFSCREGMCGTCETPVCEGDVEHRDYVLTQDQRAEGRSMMICVSRARSPLLVLDL